MKRLHLFEFCDQPWLPKSMREAGTKFLATSIRLTKVYQPTAAVLKDLMRKTKLNRLIVLGAGSGGGILDLTDELPADTKIALTDLFPDHSFTTSDPKVEYYPEPVDAFAIPPQLNGIRVLYTTFHHFNSQMAKQLIHTTVQSRQPIAIFEVTERSFRGLSISLLAPFLVLAFMPWVRPLRWSYLLWTYLIPLIPTAALWDGTVSNLRTYSVEDLRKMVAEYTDYEWKIERLKGASGTHVTSLIGWPRP